MKYVSPAVPRQHFAPMLLALALGAGALGCGQEVDPGSLEALELQPAERFAVGATFFLPTPAEGQWTLAASPDANANVVVAGDDGYARFTPVVPGEYEFVIEGSDERRTLSVVDNAPYEHFNYYQTSSLAMVEGELWVANLFDPHVSRVDPSSGQVVGTVQVGPWPTAVAHVSGQPMALVSHKAGDTLGFVDVEAGRLVDALWVGDEPADIVLSGDGATAYVSLATEGSVVIVDVAERAVVGRVATNLDPTSMALSDDGSTLYVASYRSSVSDRLQFPADDRNDRFDIAIVDTQAQEVTGYIEEVGSMLGDLLLDGDTLYVSTTRAVVSEYSNAEGMTAFRHSVVAYDVASRTERAVADLSRQASSTGNAVRPFGMAMAGGRLWVSTEGSDVVVGLDPSSLAEVARFDAAGRPRTVLADGETLFVHGAQSYQVTVASADGTVGAPIMLSGDPRGEGLALGQSLYTGVGGGAADNHSCADCHIDGLTDGNVWSAGTFSESTSRPMFWLEGTNPIGWEGDADDLFSYLYGSPTPTIGVTVTTELHEAFYDYMSALVPPPAANGLTARDGGLSAEALAGKDLFDQKGACAGCHGGPLATQGLRLPGGGTQDEHPLVVPSLVGAYRHGYWLVNGAARTLEEAVEAMLPLSGGSLDSDEVSLVARYLGELTARELFVLSSTPRAGAQHVRTEGPLTVVLSHPVFDSAENLSRVELRAADGEAVPMTVEAEGRRLTLTPDAPLAAGRDYEIVVGAEFEGFNTWTIGTETVVPFTVAQPPALTLAGDYVITIDHPNLDFELGGYDPTVTIPVVLNMSATTTSSGAILDTQVLEDLSASYEVVVDGDVAHFPPFAFPIAGFLNRSFPSEINLQDDDGDGVADSGESTLFFRSPGLEATDVRWTIARGSDMPTDCSGMEGANAVDLMVDDAGNPTVDWSGDVQALGYYVTDADAMAPTGPGPVTGGETYWALSTASFPDGFVGPVSYGELPNGAMDVSADSGAPEGGATLPAASCVKLTVVFTDFTNTVVRYETPAG